MRNKLVTAALFLMVGATGTHAQQKPSTTAAPQDQTQPSPRLNPAAQARADRLSTQMTRDLRLNGYQAAKLRAINEDKIAKMAALEQKHAGNAKLIDEQCQGVCRERDQELRSILSTDQYSAYYDSRNDFYKFDRDYATKVAGDNFVKSVRNPAPASSNGAVIRPGRTATLPPDDSK